jgi:hypothetical protein
MNLKEAQEQAKQERDKIVADPEVKCPFKKSGLLVLVYSNSENNDIIENAQVQVKGVTKPTDSNGITRWVPLLPTLFSGYNITVTGFPQNGPIPANLYQHPPVKQQGVSLRNVSIAEIPVELLAGPTIKLVKHEGGDMENVAVTLLGEGSHYYEYEPTKANGEAKWPQDKPGILPGSYHIRLTFQAKDAGLWHLVGQDGNLLQDPQIEVPKLCQKTFTFRLKQGSCVQFRVVDAKTGADIKNAKIQVKLPDGSGGIASVKRPDNPCVYQADNLPPRSWSIESVNTEDICIIEDITEQAKQNI